MTSRPVALRHAVRVVAIVDCKVKSTLHSMRDRVWIGKTWRRRRDNRESTVTQVHRPDRIAELTADATRLSVHFTDLRRKWELVRRSSTQRR